MEILQLKGVTKEFGNRIILDRASFSIKEGDIFGIIGQSGSGKTTLLNLMVGFYEPDEGEVTYQLDSNKKRKPVHKNMFEIKKRFGFASQVSSFYPKLTIKENLYHFGKLYKLKKSVLKKNIQNLLEFTELTDFQNKLAEHISVGMQKRLDLSCALIHNPKLLFLDEPTANLDPLLQKEMLHLIRHANKQGITVVIASHHLNDIERICNKIALIDSGRITTWGTVEDVKRPYIESDGTIHLTALKQHDELVRKVKYLPANKIINKGNSVVIYSSELQDTLYRLIIMIKKEKIILDDLDIKKPSLEDVFESIIKSGGKKE